MESDSNDRHEGIVKFFRGSFGWVRCSDVAQKIGDRDIFLHKNQLNSVPTAGDVVEFKLVVDAKGQPKAEKGDDELLVLREKKDSQEECLWSDLGGKVEAGESMLECAIRELDEEAQGFLSPESIALLKRGLRNQYGDGRQSPELVALKASGNKPQAVAIFPLDCSGVSLELLPAAGPNSFGVHEMCWLKRENPDLKDRSKTRWPLLRAVCALRNASANSPLN
ncbi:Ankyrin repeat domain-containing protein 17 [Durusdinium trenchii]|uniref:Ankyrin repeat domain-containing protein 17 n=1 Tax=Durusdinium trenchii TaxID=1381693 RepID=A0ABP0LV64_9DINO